MWVKMKQGKHGRVLEMKEMDDTNKELKWISLLLCLTDYTEELRFYLIHMTEVREMSVWKQKKERKKEKQGLMWTAYSVCEPEGQLTLSEITLQGKKKD